jgi:hypothetical protein
MEGIADLVDLIGLFISAIVGILLALKAHELAEFTDSVHERLARVGAFFLFGSATTPTLITKPLNCTNLVVVGKCTGGLSVSQPPGVLHGYLIPIGIGLIKEGIIVGIFFGITWLVVLPVRNAQSSRARQSALQEMRYFLTILPYHVGIITAPDEVERNAAAIENALKKAKVDQKHINSLIEKVAANVAGTTVLSDSIRGVKTTLARRSG